jgi:hypothetical protein
MKVTITITENPDVAVWDPERYSAQSNYLGITITHSNKAAAIEGCKGTVLCSIGLRPTVPNNIRFKVNDETRAG